MMHCDLMKAGSEAKHEQGRDQGETCSASALARSTAFQVAFAAYE